MALPTSSRDKFLLSPGTFRKHDMLGEGAYAKVYRCHHEGDEYAAKQFRCAELKPETIPTFLRETLLNACLTHENIVGVRGMILEPPYLYLLCELCT